MQPGRFRISLRQIIMAIALIGILITLFRSEWDGRPWQKVTAVGFSADGTKAFAAGMSGRSIISHGRGFEESITQTVVMFDPNRNDQPIRIDERYHPDRDVIIGVEPFQFAALSPDGNRLLIEWLFDAPADWDVSGKPTLIEQSATVPKHRVYVCFSDDGQLTAKVGEPYGAELRRSTTGQVLLSVSQSSVGFPPAAKFSPDGQLFAIGNFAGDLCLWQITPSGVVPKGTYPTGTNLSAFAFSNDGKRLAAATGGFVQIWNLADQKRLAGFNLETEWVACTAFLPGDDMLVCGSYDDGLVVVDVASGKPLPLIAPQLPAACFAVDAAHGRILVGDHNGDATLLDLKTLSPIRAFHVIHFRAGLPGAFVLLMLVLWSCVAVWMHRRAAARDSAVS